jgi:hypothetical protein
MIKHLVFFKFTPETTEAQKQEFQAMLDGLPGKIPQIKSYQAGADVVRSARAFDFALIMDFENLADLDIYAKHEHHLPVVERSKGICAQVASVDYEYA